jgi:hypothetical protein
VIRAICAVTVGALLLGAGIAGAGRTQQLIASIAIALGLLLILVTCLAVGLLYALRAGWRRIQADRARGHVLDEFEAEFTHVTPEYMARLADSYLTPGEDFR